MWVRGILSEDRYVYDLNMDAVAALRWGDGGMPWQKAATVILQGGQMLKVSDSESVAKLEAALG